MFGSVFLLVWASSGRTRVSVRALGRPALAGFPRDGLGYRTPIVFALARVAGQLWDDGRWTGQGEAVSRERFKTWYGLKAF